VAIRSAKNPAQEGGRRAGAGQSAMVRVEIISFAPRRRASASFTNAQAAHTSRKSRASPQHAAVPDADRRLACFPSQSRSPPGPSIRLRCAGKA